MRWRERNNAGLNIEKPAAANCRIGRRVGGADVPPPNLTVGTDVVAFVKLAPVSRTLVPVLPNVGEKPNRVGSTRKLLPDVCAEPAGAPTRMMPVTAFVG